MMTIFNLNQALNPDSETQTAGPQQRFDPLHVRQMREALQEFVDRVDKGEITSRYHYRKFKRLLALQQEP